MHPLLWFRRLDDASTTPQQACCRWLRRQLLQADCMVAANCGGIPRRPTYSVASVHWGNACGRILYVGVLGAICWWHDTDKGILLCTPERIRMADFFCIGGLCQSWQWQFELMTNDRFIGVNPSCMSDWVMDLSDWVRVMNFLKRCLPMSCIWMSFWWCRRKSHNVLGSYACTFAFEASHAHSMLENTHTCDQSHHELATQSPKFIQCLDFPRA